MTSRSLCFKLMREDLKRRAWTMALTVLGLVSTLLVPVALESGSYMDRASMGIDASTKQRLIRELVGMVGLNRLMAAVLVAICVVWAVSGFHYLHSGRQVDFYHSIPVKRSQLFLASYFNGILVPMAFYLATQMLSVLLILRTGIGADALGDAWWRIFFLNMAYYGMIYTTAVVAMMMTGNLIIALLGTVTFCAYGPWVVWLVMVYQARWFLTWYESEAQTKIWENGVCYSSPVANYVFALEDFSKGAWGPGEMAKAAAVTAALAFLAYGLYRVRPSESAGKALAFQRTQGPIKHLIAIPAGVLFGLFFYELRHTLAWAVFGVLCGSALTCCIMEIIYHFDFRKLFANRIHLAACFGISLFLVLAGMYDWYGYDSWLPDAKSVKSAAVVFDGDDWVTYGSVEFREEEPGVMMACWNYATKEEYGLENMELTDIAPVMELGKMGAEMSRLERKGEAAQFDYRKRWVAAYRMNNGKTVYRQYWIPYEQMRDEWAQVCDSPEYKRGLYPILKQEARDTARACFQQYGQSEELDLTPQETARLLEAYQKDLEELASQTRKNELPIGTIQFRTRELEEAIACNDAGYGDYAYSRLRERCYYPVYPSFARTLEGLGRAGVTLVKLDAGTVSEIRIQYRWEAGEESFQRDGGESMPETSSDSPEQAQTWEWKGDSYGRIESYDSPEDVRTLVSALVFSDYRDMNYDYEMETPYNAEVYVIADWGGEGGRADRAGTSGGFLIDMKSLSREEQKKFGLASAP